MVVVSTLGRLMGFVRDLVIARYFGASSETDAFMVAWTIPETASTLLLEGAVVFALVPLFARELESRGTLREFVTRSLAPLVAALLLITSVAALAAPWIVQALAPGLQDQDLATRMVLVTAPTIFFLGLAGYLTAALNSQQIFGIPAAVYVMYNLGIIGCIVLLEGRLGVFSAALGLAVGSSLMLAVQVPTFLRTVGLPRLSLKVSPALVYELVAFVPIGVFTIARQAQVYVERFLGSFLDPGSISQLNYATKVAQVPMSMAIIVAVVSFPAMARAAAALRTTELRQAMERDLRMVTALILPATAFVMVFAPELVSLLFQRGAFTNHDSIATAAIMRVYSLGLLAQTLVYVVVRAFFTYREKLWIPVRAVLVGLAATIVVDLALIYPLGAQGLAAGNAAGISLMALVLLRDMQHRVIETDIRGLLVFFVRALLASSVAGLCALALTFLGTYGNLSAIVMLLSGGTVLSLSYLWIGHLIGIKEIVELQSHLRHLLSIGGRS